MPTSIVLRLLGCGMSRRVTGPRLPPARAILAGVWVAARAKTGALKLCRPQSFIDELG